MFWFIYQRMTKYCHYGPTKHGWWGPTMLRYQCRQAGWCCYSTYHHYSQYATPLFDEGLWVRLSAGLFGSPLAATKVTTMRSVCCTGNILTNSHIPPTPIPRSPSHVTTDLYFQHLWSPPEISGKKSLPVKSFWIFVSLKTLHTSSYLNQTLHLHRNITGGPIPLLNHCKWLQLVLH